MLCAGAFFLYAAIVKRVASCIVIVWLSACGGTQAASTPAHLSAPAPPAASAEAPIAKTVTAPTPEPSSSAATAASPEPVATLSVGFREEIDAPVLAIALEHPPLVAALSRDRLFVHDAKGWRSEALPRSIGPGPEQALAIFYGRDDRIRVIGTRTDHDKPEGVYLRLLPAGFKIERSEIGRLGDLRGAFVAVLGTADPEIVCRPGDVCLVKRRSGWTTIAAPADIHRVVLGEGEGWAVAGKQLLHLEAKSFEPVGPVGSWQTADALFATRDRAWVVETGASRIHAYANGAWHVEPSPIRGPRALWGASADALWLAGDGGLAFFDGQSWRPASSAPAPLSVVLGRSADDVWVGGEHGLFHVEPAPAH